MDKEIEHIFSSLPSEKHYVPNTISEISPDRQVLNVTAGQNANWTYANFFILEPNSPIDKFNINEGQYVVAFRDGEWGIWDYNNQQVARGLTEVQTFVDKVSKAESLRLNYLNPEKGNTSILNSDPNITYNDLGSAIKAVNNTIKKQFSYLRAMRTKPFLLLAGISGTGKSRIVKEMAFDSCPDNSELRKDPTSPGNYCLIEVKPNWHDSSELLGYLSQIGKPHYVTTPFIKFLVKAMMHPETPFFICLDEMNLAPAEQYFAEFLSVLESRKLIGNRITSEPLIKADIFKNSELRERLIADIFGLNKEAATYPGISASMTRIDLTPEQSSIYNTLSEEGLRIPANVIVIGTVNMDETTHQFSRKVIDRAMTIEMNLPEGMYSDGTKINPFMDFYESRELGYHEEPSDASLYLPTKVSASEALEELAENNVEKTEWLKGEIAKILTNLNAKLEGTPFKVAYRVQNELVLYFYEVWRENKEADWNEILTDAVDQILMMKVLPRIDGDDTLLTNLIDKDNGTLTEFVKEYPNARKKVGEMSERLMKSQFASFWP